MALRPTLLAVASTVALASCASVALQRGTEVVVEMINAGDAAALAASSAAPFLLDDELLVRADDVSEFWQLATAAGLQLEVVEVSVERLAADGPPEYAKTMDVRTFLTSALPRRTRLVRVTLTAGSVLFLLERVTGGVPIMHGFKGPGA